MRIGTTGNATNITLSDETDSQAAEKSDGRPPTDKLDTTRRTTATSACHPRGDTSIRRLEADLNVLHRNIERMQQFVAQNPGRADEVRSTLASQRELFRSLHAAYKQRTGHDFDPRCAGDTRESRIPGWSPPSSRKETSCDYTI